MLRPILQGINKNADDEHVPELIRGKSVDEIAQLLAMEMNSMLYIFDNFEYKYDSNSKDCFKSVNFDQIDCLSWKNIIILIF